MSKQALGKASCKRTQHCWLLHVASVCTPCYMLLGVGAQSNFWANNFQHFFCSMIVGSVCTALPTFLGPRKRITHGLQSFMGCILSTIHCRSQLCWEFLHCLHTTTIPDVTTARKEIHINNDLEVVHPLIGSSSTWFLVELEFENVGFWGEGKTGVLGAQERTNNKLTWRRRRD